jgi:hypothetical protein
MMYPSAHFVEITESSPFFTSVFYERTLILYS